MRQTIVRGLAHYREILEDAVAYPEAGCKPVRHQTLRVSRTHYDLRINSQIVLPTIILIYYINGYQCINGLIWSLVPGIGCPDSGKVAAAATSRNQLENKLISLSEIYNPDCILLLV